ncbi:MAG: hypothetical protein WD737_12300 [Gemmatimonadota bacterium]
MSGTWDRKSAAVFFAVNIFAIIAAIISGYNMDSLTHRFEERQAITSISAIQLGATALVSWIVYLLRRTFALNGGKGGGNIFWLISAAGFLYLMLDETFQFHEGMDTTVARLIGVGTDPMLDGVPTALYGLAAAALCIRYRREVTRYPGMLLFYLLGGFFLAITSVLNAGLASSVQIVIEESAKLLGVVSFFAAHLTALAGTVREITALTNTARPTEGTAGSS